MVNITENKPVWQAVSHNAVVVVENKSLLATPILQSSEADKKLPWLPEPMETIEELLELPDARLVNVVALLCYDTDVAKTKVAGRYGFVECMNWTPRKLYISKACLKSCTFQFALLKL